MSRNFSGANATDRVNATVSLAAGAFSVGCWVKMVSWVTARTFVAIGTTDALATGLLSGAATAQRFRLKVNQATTDLVVEVAAAAAGGWICVVAVYANSNTATSSLIYTGSQSSPMASQAHVTDTNGSGALSIGTDGTIGKNAATGTAIDGDIAQPFMVPWQMTAAEVEAYRLGNWQVLYRGGRPTFFLPFRAGETAAYDLGATGGSWTITSTPDVSADPPISAGFKPSGGIEIGTRTPPGPQSYSGGITPTGTVAKQPSRALAGGVTPAGTTSKLVKKNLSGAFS